MADHIADKLTEVVSCHAFNKDNSMIALSPNNEEVWIYKVVGDDVKKWERKYVLKEHGGPVSGIDWCASTNSIATCGHDRNAYVWKLNPKTDTWKPTLVILRINRAATAVKWSPAGNKFAVTSGAKCVPICQFEESSDWWISKMIKKPIKSTVLTVDWCPNNKFVIVGSCDYKARIFSAYIQGLDPAEDDGFGALWADQHKFGACLAEFNGYSWINSVAWSPSAFRLAFATQNSTLNMVQLLVESAPIVQAINLKGLPFVAVKFLTDNSVVTTGFDLTPTIFAVSGGAENDPVWTFQEQLDKDDKKAATPAPAAAAGPSAGTGANAFKNAKTMFQDSSHKGIAIGGPSQVKQTSAPAPQRLNTRHTNVPTCLSLAGAQAPFTKVWTSGLDGKIILWDLNKLGVKVK